MASQTATSLENTLPTLSTNAMLAFCDDLDSMLSITMSCAPAAAVFTRLDELKSSFAKYAAVYSVQPKGILNQCFHLMLDRTGLFALSGLVVMLPEATIKQQCKQGTLDSALKLMDTVKEIGNLLVGSWDRIFREQLNGHKHLLQTGTRIADPWPSPKDVFGMESDSPCLAMVWEINVPDYPAFKCAAVFGDLKAASSESDSPQPTSASEEATVPQAEQKNTIEPAKSESDAQSDPAAIPPATHVSEDPAIQTTEPHQALSGKSEPVNASAHPVYDAIVQITQSGCPNPSVSSQILNRPAKSVMNRHPLWLFLNDSVETALQRMQQNNTRYALIEEQGQLVGILSRGDLNAAVSPYLKPAFDAYRRPLDEATLQIRIKWFMSRLMHIADPEMPVWKMMETMCRHEIRALPVQDSSGSVLGLVTVPDIFGLFIRTDAGSDGSLCPQPIQTSVKPIQPAQEEKQ